MNLTDVLNMLVEERGLDRSTLSSIVCEGMLAAYQKRYPEMPLRVEYDKKNGSMFVEVEKKVVASVKNDTHEVSLRKARAVNDKAVAGDAVWLPFDGQIGRIEILRAKQVIAGMIRDIESQAVYKEFKDRENTIIQGMVHKLEHSGTVVKIQDHLAFLPKSLSIPDQRYVVGHPIKALLKEVLEHPRSENQLILDSASGDFVVHLFKLEVPEVFEKLVEIKKIARIAGYKTKIAVSSLDINIDPVGTCVGVGGVRIKPILKELGDEKIDVISWTESLEHFVKDSLKPAEINRVELSDDNLKALVWLDDDQRSFAIGRGGQNIALASRLSGLEIELVQSKKEDLDKKLREDLGAQE